MLVRTEERADDLAKFSIKIKELAVKKGLDPYEFVDILLALVCQVSIRIDCPKKYVDKVFEKYWHRMKKAIEANSAIDDRRKG